MGSLRWCGVLVSVWIAVGAAGQSIAVNVPLAPLLPESFGVWGAAPASISAGPTSPLTLTNVSKAALEECGPQRSQFRYYMWIDKGQGIYRTIQLQAIQFGDRTGAYSAFTLVAKPGMTAVKDLGAEAAVGDGAVLFTVGSSLVLAVGAEASDVASLKPLAEAMPKVTGTKGVAPLLPAMAPDKGLVPGSLHYALGPESYAAEGGVFPAASLGWSKELEAVTAKYADKRGQETLTLLLYPTPAIAGSFTRTVQGEVSSMGPGFANAKVRREGELVLVANGTFSPDEAQKMIENIHLKQILSFDKDVQPVFHVEVQKTYSLLENVLIFCGVFGTAAVLLGLFLGFGRAAFRVMRGKPAAVEPEFLSLHLSPRNETPKLDPTDTPGSLQG